MERLYNRIGIMVSGTTMKKCKRFINCLKIKNNQKILTCLFFGGNLSFKINHELMTRRVGFAPCSPESRHLLEVDDGTYLKIISEMCG